MWRERHKKTIKYAVFENLKNGYVTINATKTTSTLVIFTFHTAISKGLITAQIIKTIKHKLKSKGNLFFKILNPIIYIKSINIFLHCLNFNMIFSEKKVI